MRWGTQDLRYIRPIKWIAALFGKDVIPFEITNVETYGTRRDTAFYQEVSVDAPSSYEKLLKEQHVIADPKVRKQMIQSQLDALAMIRNGIFRLMRICLTKSTIWWNTRRRFTALLNPSFFLCLKKCL